MRQHACYRSKFRGDKPNRGIDCYFVTANTRSEDVPVPLGTFISERQTRSIFNLLYVPKSTVQKYFTTALILFDPYAESALQAF